MDVLKNLPHAHLWLRRLLVGIVILILLAAVWRWRAPYSVPNFPDTGFTLPEQEITAADGETYDDFGISMSFSSDGSRVAIGAPAVDNGTHPGAVYIFLRTGTTWALEQKFSASDGVANDFFAISLSMASDGSRVVVGAPGIASNQGAVYVFTRSGTTWTQEQKITASDGSASDNFGFSVTLTSDGSRAAVSAYGDDSLKGSAYIFSRSGTSWTQEQKLTAFDGVNEDRFGYSISLNSDGSRIAVGHTLISTGEGSVYIFSRSGTTWTLEQEFAGSDTVPSDVFGAPVYLNSDGSRVAVGAISASSAKGAVYIFSRSGTTWSQEQKLTVSDGVNGDTFGYSIALNSAASRIAIGALLANSSQGAAYIFTRSGTTWTQIEELTNPNAGGPDSFDQFGQFVALTSDGSRIGIGAPFANADAGSGSPDSYHGSAFILFDSSLSSTPTPASGGSTPNGQVSTTVVVVGGPLTPSNFALFLDSEKIQSGTVYTRRVDTHIISETPVANYAITFGGDCDSQGHLIVERDTITTCTVTNTYTGPSVSPSPSPIPPSTIRPETYGLHEGDTISATNSNDPDTYIVNDWGYKRLFLNPIIFSFYGHLGSFANIHPVTSGVRDAFVTSGLFRNCQTNDQKVYAVQVTGEDTGILHWLNISGDQAVSQDPDFFHKVFCINTNEFNWYPKGSTYTSVGQIPSYIR